MNWTSEKSKKLYGIDKWGAPFFNVNEAGNITVSAPDQHPTSKSIDLLHLTTDLQDRGLRVPVLIRFPDILKARIQSLNQCFQNSINENDYSGEFCGVYPVKVNQEKHLVEDIVKIGTEFNLGLECGSKPELLIALSKMKNPKGLIICNGFKDKDYIETAVLSRKLGRRTIIVVDRFSELQTIIDISKSMTLNPLLALEESYLLKALENGLKAPEINQNLASHQMKLF